MIGTRRECALFALAAAAITTGFLFESLFLGKVLSPADVVYAQASFRNGASADRVPANRLLIDAVLQFQPWLEFNRASLRAGRLPLWNGLVGCGAPHLANGQSAVFDPLVLPAYVGKPPDAYAQIAGLRLWFAAMGAFLLARRWGLGRWGRWFAGLVFPFCGFLVGWLTYPVASSAAWLPWAFWASDRLYEKATPRRAGMLALCVAGSLLGGHVQTTAHVMLALGLEALWRIRARRVLAAWFAAMTLGVAVAAVEVVPLAAYLTRSPVWSDRSNERPSPLRLTRPRVLDALCTFAPYAYGSQRRGHPNLAKALGVHNVNESAGGFVGLATWLWLVPLGALTRPRHERSRFLVVLGVCGFLGGFGIPPVANLLRAVPVVDVIDPRRMTLWTAFAGAFLGGIGLDRIAATIRSATIARLVPCVALGGSAALLVATVIPRFEPVLRVRAEQAVRDARLGPGEARVRIERQVGETLRFVPRYYGFVEAQCAGIAAAIVLMRRGRMNVRTARWVVASLIAADLSGFGYGVNPAISRRDERPSSPVVDYLRRECPPPARVLGLGAELPPNTLMRYGLADVRNYDSVECSANLESFATLYEPGRSRTSRREVTWAGVARSRERLGFANVRAIVATEPPPEGLCDRVDRVGAVWIGRLDGPLGAASGASDGCISLEISGDSARRPVIRETYDPGWTARFRGVRLPVERDAASGFLTLTLPPGGGRLELRYEPPEVRIGLITSATAILAVGCMLTCFSRENREKKSLPTPWPASSARDRIAITLPSGGPHRPYLEGHEADGPFLV